jgi:hypothetical protein
VTAEIVRIDPRECHEFFIGEGVFDIPGIPVTDEGAIAAAVQRGWKQELVHGKMLLFCLDCKDK